MALLAKVMNFALNTSTGNQTISGVGFQGKAALFMVGPRSTLTDSLTAPLRAQLGVATSSSQRWCAGQNVALGGFSSSTSKWLIDNRCLADYSGTTLGYAADFVSFSADAFTINITNAPAAAYRVVALILGGDDLQNARAGTFSTNSSTPQSFTGIGFAPKAIITASAPTDTSASASTTAMLGIGCGTSSAQHVASAGSAQGSSSAFTAGVLRSEFTLRVVNTAGTPQLGTGRTALSSLDADGWTITQPGTATSAIHGYLALAGPLQIALGVETQRTSTGVKDTALAFDPVALFTASAGRVASTSVTTENRLSLGCAARDGTVGCIAVHHREGAIEIDAGASRTDDKALRFVERNSTTSVLAEADAILGTNKFTLDWTTADATAREFWYLALGSAPSLTAPDMRGGFQRNMRGGFVN